MICTLFQKYQKKENSDISGLICYSERNIKETFFYSRHFNFGNISSDQFNLGVDLVGSKRGKGIDLNGFTLWRNMVVRTVRFPLGRFEVRHAALEQPVLDNN